MSILQINHKYLNATLYHNIFHLSVKSKKECGGKATAKKSLFPERHTVGALVNGGVGFVGANQDLLQRAEVCIFAMMSTLLDSTLDALICMAVHIISSFISDVVSIC